MSSSGESKAPLSFGFKKKKDQSNLKEGAIKSEDKEEKEETEYVTKFTGEEIRSAKQKEAEKEYVIPLIQTNRWKNAVKPEDLADQPDAQVSDKSEKSKEADIVGNDIDSLAMKEVLEDTKKRSENWDKRDEEEDNNLTVPLLLKNKVPDGFETDDKLDVSIRPESSQDADYDEIPIAHFGMAMLRGMGFTEDKGVGKKGQVVKPMEAVVRPKGMGLGADRSQSKQQSFKSGSSDKQEELEWKKGSFCLVESGKHQGFYGTIEGMDEDNARVVIKLTLSGDRVTLTKYAVQLVTPKEYKTNSKILNKKKVDKYKEEEENKKKERESERDRSRSRSRERSRKSKHRDRSRDRSTERKSSKRDKSPERSTSHKDRSQDRDRRERSRDRERSRKERDSEMSSKGHRDRDSRKRQHGNSTRSDDEAKYSKKEMKSSSNGRSALADLWVQPHLRVRLVDKSYKKGKYYKDKIIIEDVASMDSCVCRTDEGKVLEDISQDMLETVIPRSERAFVMIVRGKHRKQLCEVLEKDKVDCEATVQLLSDRDKVLNISFDDICEYTGNIDHEFDY